MKPPDKSRKGDVVQLDEVRSQRSELAPLAVLLVEDDEIDATLVEMALQKSSWFHIELTRARTMPEAQDLLRMASFDLMLLDFWLGDENGLALLESLGGRHSHLPVILLTGYTNQDVQRLGHNAGALSFLSKDDMSANTLDTVIRSTLHTHNLERELRASIKHRDDALRSQLDMFASISRDVERPLQRISDTARDLREAAGEQKNMKNVADAATLISRDIVDLRNTVLLLLDQARAGGQNAELRFELLDLNALAEKALRLINPQIVSRQQKIAIAKSELPIVVMVDETAMLQALLNIVDNASKFSADGGRVFVGLSVEGGNAVVSVDDQGRGMSEGEVQRALQSFGKTGIEGDGGPEANGLGLSIVADIMHHHSGRLDMQSVPNEGTCVRLTVPLSRE